MSISCSDALSQHGSACYTHEEASIKCLCVHPCLCKSVSPVFVHVLAALGTEASDPAGTLMMWQTDLHCMYLHVVKPIPKTTSAQHKDLTFLQLLSAALVPRTGWLARLAWLLAPFLLPPSSTLCTCPPTSWPKDELKDMEHTWQQWQGKHREGDSERVTWEHSAHLVLPPGG